MNSKKKRRGQMSEAFCTAMFLSLSGGLQDVYTYLFRGKVFANAQTGNIVLMAVHAFAGEWGRVLHYLVPLCFFALGVFAAELMHQKLQNLQRLHWRQLVVLCEIVMLFVVGFFPQEWNLMANALVSFACAMQVQTFRKVNGYAFASTMCIGNMRSGTEALCVYFHTHDREVLKKALDKFVQEIEKAQKQMQQPKTYRGKQSIKHLMSQNAAISNIEVTDGNIKSFERTAALCRKGHLGVLSAARSQLFDDVCARGREEIRGFLKDGSVCRSVSACFCKKGEDAAAFSPFPFAFVTRAVCR